MLHSATCAAEWECPAVSMWIYLPLLPLHLLSKVGQGQRPSWTSLCVSACCWRWMSGLRLTLRGLVEGGGLARVALSLKSQLLSLSSLSISLSVKVLRAVRKATRCLLERAAARWRLTWLLPFITHGGILFDKKKKN